MKQFITTFILSIIHLPLITSCYRIEDSSFQNIEGNINLSCTIVSYSYCLLPTDSLAYRIYDVWQNNKESFLIILNENKKSLEIYNLTHKTKVFSKPTNTLGISEKDEFINSMDFWNFDSIFFATENHILLTDTIKVKKKIVINNNLSKRNRPLKLYNLDHSPLRFDYLTNNVLMESYSPFVNSSSTNYYKLPIECSFNTSNGAYESLAVQYPNDYRKYYFGFANQVFRTVSGRFNIYSFPVDNNFYVYNRESKAIDTITGRILNTLENSKLSKKYRKESEKKMDHMTTIPFHLNVLHDPKKKLFYWFHMGSLPLKNNDGTYNTWADKELYLDVYTENGEYLHEISLGKYQYSYFKSFVGAEGLFISRAGLTSSLSTGNSLEFDIFQFEND